MWRLVLLGIVAVNCAAVAWAIACAVVPPSRPVRPRATVAYAPIADDAADAVPESWVDVAWAD